VDAIAGEHVSADQLGERPQKDGAAADLVGERRHAEIDALARIALGLPIERLVLPILLEQDHGEQARPGEAARQHRERRRRLADLLAVSAGELLAYDLYHLPLPWHRLEPLGHVLAELGEPARAAAGARRRAGHHHALARQMRRERLARGLPASERANRRGCRRLLGRKLVLAVRGFQLLELELHLVEQARFALIARSEQAALELLDDQLLMGDQGLRARCLGARLRKLGLARLQQPLQHLDVIGERISRAHRAKWNHKMQLL